MDRRTERHILLWAMLLSSLIGITIWYIKRLTAAPVGEWGAETVAWLSYFTIFSNLLAIIMAGALLYGRGRLAHWFQSPSRQSAICLYIAFVGLGFWFLLGGPKNAVTFLDWVPEILAHTLSPILGAIFWYRCVPKGHLTWRDAVVWLAYPIAYLIYWLIRGPRVGYYPYFFIDVNALGYSGVAMWSGVLVVVFLVLGILMWRVDRWQASR
ncbi:MAG: Pr6Pr family membrane protein [Ardenticatenaceae bacterium]|nr:Pr6Pr family membrane protein [Ardenticatenaceae bacterium]